MFDLMDLFGVIGIGSMILLLILIVASFASYILGALGIMKLATREQIENGWLAFIPVGNLYIIGKLVKVIDFGGKQYTQPEYIFPGAMLASFALGRVPVIGSVVNILSGVVSLYAFFCIYKLYAPKAAVKYIVLTILLFCLPSGFIFYKIKDEDRVEF